MESDQGKIQPFVLWVPETTTVTWGLYVNGEVRFCLLIFWVRWGFLWLLYFPLQKVQGECVYPVPYLRRVEGQQSGACPHAWQHLLVTTAVDQDCLGSWEWHRQRQKKVRAGGGTCFRVCPWREQPQAAEGSFHWSSVLRGESAGSGSLLFCTVQRAGSSVVMLDPVFCVQRMGKGPLKGRWWSFLSWLWQMWAVSTLCATRRAHTLGYWQRSTG